MRRRGGEASISGIELRHLRKSLPADAHGVTGLFAIGVIYFVLAKLGLELASINPSASPVWPPTGFALAAVLLRGYAVWPAIFVGAFLANVTTAGSAVSALGIATGNTLEAVLGGVLINTWSQGCATFENPLGVAKFALVGVVPAALVSATVGVGSLFATGFVARADFFDVWLTWWLGDIGGGIILTPAIVLFAVDDKNRPPAGTEETAALYASTVLVGIAAFSPLIEQTAPRGALAFIATAPLVWAALRRGPRDTAIIALILSGFAVWGTLSNGGPFARAVINDSFLLLLAFVIGTAVPSLALSTEVAVRRRTEEELREAKAVLDERVEERTAALTLANRMLENEIAQRRQVEAEREQQRVHLLDAQRLANLGSWVWDIRENKVNWSEQLHSIFGIPPAAFGGTFEDYLSRVHEEDRQRVQQHIMEAFEAGRGFKISERIVRPDGEIRHLQSSGEVIKDAAGQSVQMVGTCHDVTEQNHIREQLAQSQKLDALGQLTGGVAHDFSNLLMIIGGQARLLAKRITDEKQLKAIEAIDTAVTRGAGLTRRLLSFARRRDLAPTVVDIRERVETVRSMLERSLEHVAVTTVLPGDLWTVEVDPSELELAVVNLLVNARDAMADGGRIRISAKNVALKDDGQVSGLSGDFVALSVEDRGAGIDPEVLPKVFDAFFTTKPTGKGTGLGLSQVHGFAHQSGGTVTVDSTVGQGTCVTLYLRRSM